MRVYNSRLTTVTVATGTPGNTHLLQASVRRCPDESLFFSWTGGGCREPDNLNCTKYKRSVDHGHTWDEEKILCQHPRKGMYTPQLFVDGGSLYTFSNCYAQDTSYAQDFGSYWSQSVDSGKSFSPLRGLQGCLNTIQVRSAQRVGEKIICTCSWHEIDGEHWAPPYDGPGAKPCITGNRIVPANRNQQEWQSQVCTEYCGVLISEGDPFGDGYWRLHGRIGQRKALSFCEPQLLVRRDGTLVMLLRVGHPWLYEARSHDGGETWTEAGPTSIPSAMSLVRVLKDSNGTVYLIHNPNPSGRSPLELWISHDDMDTWAEKHELVREDGEMLCYPEGFIDEEKGCLCLAWDDRNHVYYSEFTL